jgi:lysophospholipase L1-like esterase
MSQPLVRKYVAIGDSLSEGLGDWGFETSREGCGWTDRLAGLLGEQAAMYGQELEYANLAIRGSKMLEILTAQLEDAIALKPDLVTIMAGSNDLMKSRKEHPALRALLRGAIERLLASGSQVVVANTINPLHLRIFKKLARRAESMTRLIEETAAEYGVPVLDVFRIEKFNDLCFWAEDMVHFSGYGHTRIANKAADLLNLSHRFEEEEEFEMLGPGRNFFETMRWIWVYVLPFIGRRIRGVSSGDGLEPKYPAWTNYSNDEWPQLRLAA